MQVFGVFAVCAGVMGGFDSFSFDLFCWFAIHMFLHLIVHIAHITLQVGLMFFSTGRNAYQQN